MTFYSDMADVADDLITEFGQDITLKIAAGTAMILRLVALL